MPTTLSHPPAARAPESSAARTVHVLLPVYNEGPAVATTVSHVAAFAAAHPGYRFTFVDDGSPDGTRDFIEAALRIAAIKGLPGAERIDTLGYRTNGGKGYALLRAVRSLEGRGGDDDPVLFTDGDLAYSLDHLPTLVHALQTADVVIGSRRAPDGGYRAHPARNLMGWVFNRLARLCLHARYRDTQAGLKGFRLGPARRIFGALRVSGFAFDVEVLYLARRWGYRIAEVPAVVDPSHRARPSRVSLLRDPRRMFVSLAGIRISGALGQYERRSDGRQPLALMSFDAEEFDLPNELGHPVNPERQMAVGADGLRRALDLLDEVPARATFFMTSALARAHPALVRDLVGRGHELASHGRAHTGFSEDDLLRSRHELEDIAGVPIRGFRRPRFAATDPAAIARAGYTYDSSINPVWVPGRYNGWKHPRRAYETAGLVEIPVSATPLVRFPLFWLAFKNAPAWSMRTATRWALAADGYAALCFHPWELCDLRGYGLPRMIRRIDGASMESRLTRYLRWLSRRATFATYGDLERRFRAAQWPFAPAGAVAPETAEAPGASLRS